MMYRHIIILQLVAFVSTQTIIKAADITRAIHDIFGTPCKTTDDMMGVCVTYYQCSKNGTVVTDGTDIIDIRVKDGPCPSYLDVCCLLDDVSASNNPNEAEPKHKDCGWRNPQGVGFQTIGDNNHEAKFGEFPWMVAVIKLEPVNQDNPSAYVNLYLGGGSLINPSAVLTAAHTARGRPLLARAGEWDTQTEKEVYPYQDRNVKEVVVHKDFNGGNLFYDIALLFLESPMTLAPNVGVVCLPPQGLRAKAGSKCFASGWGKDKFGKEGNYQNIMKKVELPVVDRKVCQNNLRKTRLGSNFLLHTSFMCAGGEPGVDTCEGDGGSPLVCPIEFETERYMQSGIVSWGIGCGQDGAPGVYVDVANLRGWIDNEIIRRGLSTTDYTFK
ncbi:unnamed protein product, partial [Brenthis ino]